jgi:small-conductance mechanosensitive channel
MTAPTSAAADAPIEHLADATADLGTGIGGFLRWVVSVQGQAVVALGVAALVTVVILAARRYLRRALERGEVADDRWRAILRDVVRRLLPFFVVMVGMQAGLALVDAPDEIDGAARVLFVIAAVLQGAVWAQTVAIHLLTRFVARHGGEQSSLANAFVLLRWAVMVVVWSVALLLLLDNLGVNVTALVAGLGIGGVAIALASQNTIASFFSAFQIVTDRPFNKGDLIRFGGMSATVEEIRIRTTRLRSLDGHEVIVPNSKLMDETIDNLNRMAQRRAVVTIGIAYETPPSVVREVPGLIEACVRRVETAIFSRCHLAGFGPSSLDYELVFFANGRDYPLMMATKQEVLFNVFEAFAQRGIVIAYPTQTIYLQKGADPEG